MSLLSDLLNHMPPAVVDADKPATPDRTTGRSHLALVERPARPPSNTYTYADSATPQWRKARDCYINHLMACRSCYAPTGHYCQRGAELRATYEATPMETQQ